MEKTAFQQAQEEAKNDRLNRSIAAFIERYAPKDSHDAAVFNAHLHEIVRAVYADMSKPVEHALSAALTVATPHVWKVPEHKD